MIGRRATLDGQEPYGSSMNKSLGHAGRENG